jgi:hypothetical protein
MELLNTTCPGNANNRRFVAAMMTAQRFSPWF